VPQTMQGPEVFGQARGLFDAGHLLIDIGALISPTSREDIRAAGFGVGCQELAGRLVQGYFLVNPTLGIANVDKTPLKIHVMLLQPKKLAPPHAGEQGQLHQIAHYILLGTWSMASRRALSCSGFRSSVLRLCTLGISRGTERG